MLLDVPLLLLGFLPVTIPVGVRDFDIEAELWVRLKLIPVQPWVGTLTWAFVSMPKVQLTLAPFRIVNLRGESVLRRSHISGSTAEPTQAWCAMHVLSCSCRLQCSTSDCRTIYSCVFKWSQTFVASSTISPLFPLCRLHVSDGNLPSEIPFLSR